MTRITILAYHGVGPRSPGTDPFQLLVRTESFAQQMEYLARRTTVVSLEAVMKRDVPRSGRIVALTFDDGYKSVYENALPILERHGFPATVFLPTAVIGRANDWDPGDNSHLSIMDDSQLRDAQRHGIAIESHGHAHLDMSTAAAVDVEGDLRQSVESIAALRGEPPRFLAYPFGRHSEVARRAAQKSGFEAAFGIDAPSSGRYALGRVQVTSLDGMRMFALKASGFYPLLRWSPVTNQAYRVAKPLLRRLRS
jgi:peptidoglycan/xylan/chitin deacetylase (PgdA/CDA1 family)